MKITNIKILKGIGLMLLGMTIVPFLDIFAKLLSQEGYHVTQVTWTRFFFHAVWLLPMIMWQKVKLFSIPEKPGLQFLAGLDAYASNTILFCSHCNQSISLKRLRFYLSLLLLLQFSHPLF